MSNQLVSPLYYVYKLTFESGKTYVGLHIQRKLNDNYITSSSYYKNHPEDAIIKREILVYCNDKESLSFMETWCILSDKAYNGRNNVNYNLGAFIHRMCGNGHKPSEETRRKMSESQKAYNKAHPHTDEYRKKMSESCKKVVHTDTWRKNQSKALMGHKISDETKNKISNAHKGQKLSQETKDRISKSIKGIKKGPWSEERKKQFSDLRKSTCDNSKRRWYTNGTENIYILEDDDIPPGFFLGKTQHKKYELSEEGKQNNKHALKTLGKVCYNNGIINIFIPKEQTPPEGFVKGRLKK